MDCWGCDVGAEPLAAAAPSGSGGGFMGDSWDARRDEGWEVEAEAGGFWWLLLPFEGAVAGVWVVACGRRGEGGTEFKSGAMTGGISGFDVR